MFTHLIDSLLSNSSVRKRLPSYCLHLLLLLLGIQFARYDPGVHASSCRSPSVQSLVSQNHQELTTLELGKPIERELTGGQKHSYQITLAAGQYVKVEIMQLGIEVGVSLLQPDDKTILVLDMFVRAPTVALEQVVESSGVYRLEVYARAKAPAGRYEVRIAERRPATKSEHALQEARKLFGEVIQLQHGGKYVEASPLILRAQKIYEKVKGQEDPKSASVFQIIGALYSRKGEYERAEPFYQRALEIAEKVLPGNDLRLATFINELALNNLWRGNYEIAETLLQRALVLYENAPDDPLYLKIGYTLNCLARIYVDRGDYARAESAGKRILTIWEKAYGPESRMVATALADLADAYRIRGDYIQAESLLVRALPIADKAARENQPDANITLELAFGALATLYIDKGDYGRAEALLECQQAILEKLGPDYPFLSEFLDTLATVSQFKGNFEKAERLSMRALAIREKSNGPEHLVVSDSLFRLATLYYYHGDHAKAGPLLLRALGISEKALGAENPTRALILDMQANVHRARADYAGAESLYREALAITEKLFGSNHPKLAKTMDNLATLLAAKGDGAQAVMFQARANAIDEHNIGLNLATGSERHKLAYLDTLSDKVNKTISFQLSFAPDDPGIIAQAATLVLQRKGRVQDAMTDSLANLRRHLTAEDQELLGKLNATTAQLARLVLEGSQEPTMGDQQKRINALEEQKEKLEDEISQRSRGFYQQSQPVTLAAIRSLIPENAALIELAVYRPFDPKANDAKAFGEPRYVAYVLRRHGEVQWKELGTAKQIDAHVNALQQALRDPKRQDVQLLARAVDERVMQPVRKLVGDAVQLLISADGELNLIPFGALVGEQGRYLIERYSFAYLTSGRDLLRMQVAHQSKSPPVVVADPAFGDPALIRPRAESISVNGAGSSGRPRIDYSQIFFGPLPGVNDEVRALRILLPNASFLTREQATKAALQGVVAPSILHIATHGFFLSEPGAVATGPVAQSRTRSISATAKIENPLLRSGLALAGANLRANSSYEGVLTALEASSLNLWGTKLVVLSACDTGVGEVRAGEGVYGLRRALVLAGAESQLMSLWPVSDRSTRDLMISYYKSLVRGQGRGDSLRRVQLQMLQSKSHSHPYYWASFIQTGEWANLEGKR
ncbi:MAG TPA: CHAT domain-containing tetratricopeptide repeat protein [Pyrinomonadaceae bacterium]|nr:CHAT domain-containing tetratricopeptide repeat protein [Pyrinomonadaceae bacterium]